MRVKRDIALRRAPGNPREGRLVLAHGVRRAALGRSGIKALKREGEGATPLGRFPVRQVLYRADRVTRPRTVFPLRAIRADDGWCENLYNLILILGHNDRPRVRGRGSAIFVHLARPGYAPTAGCIALSHHDLLMLLAQLRRGSAIYVLP